jgi:hypothetical protein
MITTVVAPDGRLPWSTHAKDSDFIVHDDEDRSVLPAGPGAKLDVPYFQAKLFALRTDRGEEGVLFQAR